MKFSHPFTRIRKGRWFYRGYNIQRRRKSWSIITADESHAGFETRTLAAIVIDQWHRKGLVA